MPRRFAQEAALSLNDLYESILAGIAWRKGTGTLGLALISRAALKPR
jgi:hypothetical protein